MQRSDTVNMNKPLLIKQYIITIMCLITASNSYAQENISAKEAVINHYFSSIGEYAAIYSGKEQNKYPSFYKNHPYYKTDSYQEGTLSFDGIVYPNVKLRLDLNLEELAILSLDNRFNIVIPSDRLDYAYIGSDYITINKGENPLPKGFNIRLYEGEHSVWLKQSCLFTKRIEDRTILYQFDIKKRFYVYKDGQYHKIGSLSSLLKLFPEQKEKLKRHIKATGLNFRSSPENTIVEVVKQYEILIAL